MWIDIRPFEDDGAIISIVIIQRLITINIAAGRESLPLSHCHSKTKRCLNNVKIVPLSFLNYYDKLNCHSQ